MSRYEHDGRITELNSSGASGVNTSVFYTGNHYDSVIEVSEDSIVDSLFEINHNSPQDKKAIEAVKLIAADKKNLDLAYHETAEKENIIIFLGRTKAGKSTLINYIISNKLETRFDDKEYKFKIIAQNLGDGPQIGLGPEAETKEPKKWRESTLLPGKVILDTPGFNDNRDPVQDITNALYISRLLKNASSIQLVLVSAFHDIYGRNVAPFKNLLHKVHDLFPSISDNLKGVSIIFTHYENPNRTPPPSYTDVIPHILISKFITTPFFADKPELQQLVEHFINNPQSIAVFECPTQAGDLEFLTEESPIIQSINNAETITREHISNIKLSISLESKLFLYEHSEYIFYDFVCALNQIRQIYLEFIKNSDKNWLFTQKDIVNHLISICENSGNLSQDDLLDSLLVEFREGFVAAIPITETLINNEISRDITLIKFLDQLIQFSGNKNILLVKFKSILNEIKYGIIKAIFKTKETSHEVNPQDKENFEQDKQEYEFIKQTFDTDEELANKANRTWSQWAQQTFGDDAIKKVTRAAYNTTVEVLKDLPHNYHNNNTKYFVALDAFSKFVVNVHKEYSSPDNYNNHEYEIYSDTESEVIGDNMHI